MKTHERFMKMALVEARDALGRNEFPVGCLLVADGEVVAQGSRQNSRFFDSQQSANELDHAEIVALRNLIDQAPDTERRKITVYSTMEPCLMCFSTLILNNLHKIVYAYEDVMGGGSDLPLHLLRPLYRQKEVTVIPGVLRSESLDLFKKFFASPDNNYWQDSLLAKYTLEQP